MKHMNILKINMKKKQNEKLKNNKDNFKIL